MAKEKSVLGSKVEVKDAGVKVNKEKKAAVAKKETKTITITMEEGKRATATFSSNVRGHDVDVVSWRLKRMYRVYRENQRKQEEKK